MGTIFGSVFETVLNRTPQFPGGNFWAILFFMMLFTLGLDSQFGTLQGVIQCFIDLKLLPNLRKEILTGEAIKRCPICWQIWLVSAVHHQAKKR